MRIERLRIPALGPLRGIDTGDDPLPGFVVVTGPNEAGKTTLLEAIRTLLHGIYPARREANPLSPWDGTEGEVLGDFRTRDGHEFRAHRRILAAPWGRLLRNDAEEDLRNAHLPAADHVPREIYRQVHAIDLPELTRLQQGNAWDAIRDRILAGMGTRDLAPPRTVADDLEREANALWRPDRKSKVTRDLVLGAEIDALTAGLREARNADVELRQARDAVELGDAKLSELRQERAELAERVRRAAELLPLGARIRHLDTLRLEAGDPVALATLPASPRERRRELVEAEEALEAEVRSAAAALREAEGRVTAPTHMEARLLELGSEVEALRVEAAGADDALERARHLGGEVARVQADVEDLATPLLVDPGAWLEPSRRADLLHLLRAVPTEELRVRLVERSTAEARVAEAEERLAAHRARSEASAPTPRAASTTLFLLAMAAVVLLAAMAVFVRDTAEPWIVLMAVLGAVALAATAFRIRAVDREATARHDRARAEHGAEADALDGRLRTHVRALSEASDGILATLADLPLRPDRVEGAREGFATSLERLRERLRELERLESTLLQEEERVGRARQAISAVMDRLELEPSPASASAHAAPSAVLAPLLARLEEADRAAERRAGALRDVELAKGRHDDASRRLDDARARRASLDAALDDLLGDASTGAPEGRTSDGVEVAERRLEALRQFRDLERELQAVHGSLEELRARVRDAEREWHTDGTAASAADLAAAHASLEALAGEIESAATELQRNRSILERIDRVDTPDLLEAERDRLQLEREDVRRERDRLWVLARVTRVAEQRFREAHQPMLVHRAEEILSGLTRGRYRSLLLGDESDPGALQVRGDHLPGALPVEPPLSTGIREQIWFSLRMAVVDLVEGGGEPLPLVLDEVFVNWDPDRRGAALDALAAMADHRQIFLVTCHPAFAREAESRGARIVELAPLNGEPRETPA